MYCMVILSSNQKKDQLLLFYGGEVFLCESSWPLIDTDVMVRAQPVIIRLEGAKGALLLAISIRNTMCTADSLEEGRFDQ